jgi:hypothetical protein
MMDTWTWTMDVMNLVIFLIEIKLNLVILHPMYSGTRHVGMLSIVSRPQLNVVQFTVSYDAITIVVF